MVMQKACGEPIGNVRDDAAGSLREAIRGLSQPWDIKAFKGKGALRSLAACHRKILERLQQEMEVLALSTERVNAGCFLRLVCESGRGARLRWCVRGQPSFYIFEGLRELMAALPPQVAEFFKAAEGRANELALLESIHRSAAKRIEDFLRPAIRGRAAMGRAAPGAQGVHPVNTLRTQTRAKSGAAAAVRGVGKSQATRGSANRSRASQAGVAVRLTRSNREPFRG